MRQDRVIVAWKLYQVPIAEGTWYSDDPGLADWADLAHREEMLGVRAGQWFLMPSDGWPDTDVLAFCNSWNLKYKSRETQRAYMHDLKVHLEFLGAKGTTWRKITPSDIDDYEFWRRRDLRNARTVSASKFNRELAACRLFYELQTMRGAISASPILLTNYSKPDGTVGSAPALRAKAYAANDVKWLTPAAYRLWRDVGLGGYLPSGVPDASWRGRNDGRNLAFAEALWSSGLRLREAATLLLSELPVRTENHLYHRATVGSGVAKFGISRDFWLTSDVLRRIHSYRISTRQLAVDRARQDGRYDNVPGSLVIRSFIGNSVGRIALKNGGTGKVRLNRLEEDERLRTFMETEDGLEPLSLWLGDSGMPLRTSTWHAVFGAANRRINDFDLGSTAGPLYCRAHMLRHSFALRMLVTLQRAFDKRMGLSPEERKEYRMLFGDPWVLVSHLLGHRSIETTRDIYLEPAKGLQFDSLMNGEPEEAAVIERFLTGIAVESGLIHYTDDEDGQSQ